MWETAGKASPLVTLCSWGRPWRMCQEETLPWKGIWEIPLPNQLTMKLERGSKDNLVPIFGMINLINMIIFIMLFLSILLKFSSFPMQNCHQNWGRYFYTIHIWNNFFFWVNFYKCLYLPFGHSLDISNKIKYYVPQSQHLTIKLTKDLILLLPGSWDHYKPGAIWKYSFWDVSDNLCNVTSSLKPT